MIRTEKKSTPLPIRSALPYVVPFALFGLLSYLGPVLSISGAVTYPVKMVLVAACLLRFRKAWGKEIKPELDWAAIGAGVLVFFIWILPESVLPQVTASRFNPYAYASGGWALLLIAVRLAGAVLVVPLMEELFWRSFALRYLIRDDFRKVPMGSFSRFSFIVVSIAFGFAHERWLVGIVAGVFYALVLYRSKNLFSPILSHAVTNLLLAIYVLGTHQWSFW